MRLLLELDALRALWFRSEEEALPSLSRAPSQFRCATRAALRYSAARTRGD
jgi:hypothetical protein